MLSRTKRERAIIVLDYFRHHQSEKHELRTWFDMINSKLPKLLRFKSSYEFSAAIKYLKSKGHLFNKKKTNIKFKGHQINITWIQYDHSKKKMSDV